jgi:lysozyme
MIKQMTRHITTNGISLIKQLEGFSPVVYLDFAGFLTIGYGHLILPSEKLSFNSSITETEAEFLLKQDLNIAERAVIRLINAPLIHNQFDSLVSFTFNLGAGTLQRSTLRRKVNRSEHEQVLAEFLRWIYADGKKILGLVRRRTLEAELYMT